MPRHPHRGHIQQRGPATFRVHVSLGRDPDGRRLSVSRTVHGTREEAERALSRLLVEADEGRHHAAPGSLRSLSERWWQAAAPNWTANTRVVHRSALDRHILPALGDMPARRLRAADLDRLYGRMAASGVGPATIRRVHVVARRMLAQAVRWDELGTNPAAGASPPTVGRAEVRPPSPDEVRLLIKEADTRDPDLAVFLRLAAASGCRRAELCALTWDDLDLERGQLSVTKALSAAGAADGATKQTKTGNRRRIRIDDTTVAQLVEHRRRMAERADKVGRSPGIWVFSHDPAGRRPWHPSSVSHRFKRIARALGIDTRLHALRHFSATRALDAGMPVIAVSHRLGHTRSSTTSDLYGHWVPDRDDALADTLGRLLDGPDG